MSSMLSYLNTGTRQGEITVDLFAGGGGASEGIRAAIGRDRHVAVNHNPRAVAMHQVNHPGTRHYIEDVWSVSPTHVTKGAPMAEALVSANVHLRSAEVAA